MKKFLVMVGLALLIFLVTVFAELRDLFIFPTVARGTVSSSAAKSEAVRDVVRRYNLALVQAYRQGDPAPLDGLVGDAELREVVASDLRFLAGRGRRLTLELVELEVVEARAITESMGFVETREEWRYGYAGAQSRWPPRELKTLRAEMTYTLERQAGSWRIVETGLKRRMSARAG